MPDNLITFHSLQIPFDITFCPKQTNRDIRYEVKSLTFVITVLHLMLFFFTQKVPCAIEGRGPLYITLTGTCIEQVPLKEVS